MSFNYVITHGLESYFSFLFSFPLFLVPPRCGESGVWDKFFNLL